MTKTIKMRDGKRAVVQTGQVVVLDIFGNAIRVQPTITSWMTPAYRLEANGDWRRLA